MDILIIDDDSSSVFVAKIFLNHLALFDSITAFHDPKEALSFIQNRTREDRLPGIILLDLNMPLMDGWQLLDALKSLYTELTDKTCIYILTSSTDISDINRANEHPLVTDIIFKPIGIKKIQEIYDHAM